MTNIKVGADPEFFLWDTQQERFVSAHDMVPGTKAKPHPLKKGALQADGTAVEFNIDAASSPEEFASNVETVLKQVREFIPKRFEFKFQPVVEYGKEYFAKLPETAKELGCDPDFDAWNQGRENPRPTPQAGSTMRTGSGHIHVGWTDKADVEDRSHRLDCIMAVQYLDVAYNNIRQIWDTDTKRASLYGRNGAFRYKPYGMEYRTPSNAWLNHPELWPKLFELSQFAINECERARANATAMFPQLLSRSDSFWIPKPRTLALVAHEEMEGFPLIPLLKPAPILKEKLKASASRGRPPQFTQSAGSGMNAWRTGV